MHFELWQYLVLGGLSFAAGFLDSIAGGGGLISLPAYFALGLPAHLVLGTNKFSSSLGTLFATFRYFRTGNIHYRVAVFSVAGALLGSPLGAKLALISDEGFLKILLIILLPLIALLVLMKKDFGALDLSSRLSNFQISMISGITGLVIGAYDGYFGPGTGTFFLLAFTAFLGLPMMTATGNAKIVNLSSNLGALAAFLIGGKVLFDLGLVAGVFGIAGNWIGSGLAIKKGAGLIRPVVIVGLALLLAKILFDLFH